MTNGIISSKSGFKGDITNYQISVPLQPGNSGGPLFNSNGELIGIVSAKHSSAENVSYSIKTTYLDNLIQSLEKPLAIGNANRISGKSLPEQVKAIKDFVYIIEVK